MVIVPLFSNVNLHAQHSKCTIAGKVIDERGNPIEYTSVAIYEAETPIVGVVTDNEGKFSLKVNQRNNEHRLVVGFVGYTKYEAPISLNTSHINLGTITLHEDIISIGEMVVTAKEVAQKSTVEHTTINASANMSSGKGTAIDILRSSSSVSITNNEISIRGNSNILVLIDGTPTTASDLSTIPAANIQSIEVITNPDASHDAGGTGGLINIISKRTNSENFSGIVATNYGFNHFANGNIILALNRKKASWRFSYNTKYEDDVVNTTLNRKIHSAEYELFQQMQSTRYTFNNNITFGTDLRINESNRISVDLKAIIPRLNIKQVLHNTFTKNETLHEEFRHNDVNWNRESYEGSLSYTHDIIPEVSDITIRGSISKIWGERPSYYSLGGEQINRSVSGGNPHISMLQADYKYKFKTGTFTAGAKFTHRKNHIYHQFYTMNDGQWIYEDVMSNDLLHTEIVPALYAMFSSRIGNKFTYKIGLREEFSTVTLNSEHKSVDTQNNSFFLAPSLSFTYKLSKNQELSSAISRRIGRPTYPQLTPYMSMVDATTYEQGNMYLKPEKSTKVDLSYNLRGEVMTFFTNGYVNYTTDYISQIMLLDNERLITTYVNADKDLKMGVEFSFKAEPIRWANLSVGTNTYYVTTSGTYEESDIDNSGWTNNSNLTLNFMAWRGNDIQVQYIVTTPQYYPQLTTSLTHQMDIGIKQRLLKDAMTFSLLVTDVLNTAKWKVQSNNDLFELKNSSKNKSRMLWLGMSYNFNSFKQKSSQKDETDRSLIRLGM
ncbi:MAG: TonB-dependent receptor [Bacteroidaceae bacterium]|nr:TonB-dependent receptor [Bacteroidaceae bacterium]